MLYKDLCSTHFSSSCTTHVIEARTTAQHVQLVTELYLIFNKLDVSRLESRLSVFVIISSYIRTLSIMTNDDNLESNLLTSSLLKMCSLYKLNWRSVNV